MKTKSCMRHFYNLHFVTKEKIIMVQKSVIASCITKGIIQIIGIVHIGMKSGDAWKPMTNAGNRSKLARCQMRSKMQINQHTNDEQVYSLKLIVGICHCLQLIKRA